ncbi:MAG: hypothetical protein JNL05_04800, partial [Flavobacteriales bacterium]|nr:hypothetical protein [Flavobacteriales bacterium]
MHSKAAPAPKRRRRWRWWLLMLLPALAVLVVQPLLERKARALVLQTLQGHGTPEEAAKLDIRLQLLQ